jgi:hypothetical protein
MIMRGKMIYYVFNDDRFKQKYYDDMKIKFMYSIQYVNNEYQPYQRVMEENGVPEWSVGWVRGYPAIK